MTSAVSKPPRVSIAERSFGKCVAVAAIGGFGVRVANAFALPKNPPLLSDATYYHVQANLLSKGHGFADPFAWLTTGRLVPSAAHPPLFPLVLSIVSWFGGTSAPAHRVATGAIGAVTIIAIALIAREIAGSAAAIVAAFLAAVYPNLWGLEGSLMSESLAAALVALALLVAVRTAKRPTLRNAALLAIMIALASLTRPETLLLVPVLAIPVIVAPRSLTALRKIVLATAIVAMAGIVVAPWLLRNATGFSRPVFFSTQSDEVLGVTNCPVTYYQPKFLGDWYAGCARTNAGVADEAKSTSLDRNRGLHYMRSHLDRFLGTVVWARLGRVADVYRPFENARYSASEGRRGNVAIAGLLTYWACLPFALIGGVVLWRRNRAAMRILLAPFLVVIVTAIYAWGAVRFRAIAEPSIIVLAAIGIVTAWQNFHGAREAEST
jgi:asparagine N-glycosylation enzyme membrane subunit Stt3